MNEYEEKTERAKRAGMICASCKSADDLSSDAHVTYCRMCGPSYPLIQGIPGKVVFVTEDGKTKRRVK